MSLDKAAHTSDGEPPQVAAQEPGWLTPLVMAHTTFLSDLVVQSQLRPKALQ